MADRMMLEDWETMPRDERLAVAKLLKKMAEGMSGLAGAVMLASVVIEKDDVTQDDLDRIVHTLDIATAELEKIDPEKAAQAMGLATGRTGPKAETAT